MRLERRQAKAARKVARKAEAGKGPAESESESEFESPEAEAAEELADER